MSQPSPLGANSSVKKPLSEEEEEEAWYVCKWCKLTVVARRKEEVGCVGWYGIIFFFPRTSLVHGGVKPEGLVV